MYTLSPENGIVRDADGMFIPADATNPDWIAYEEWRAEGNTPNPYVAPPAEYSWYIDIGPFFDRFAGAKMSVLTSEHPVAKAVVTDVMVRKWIDLKIPAVGAGIDALIAVGIPGVTVELKNQILNTPVLPEEQSALVKLYFSRRR